MNVADYFFENVKHSNNLFVVGTRETISFSELYKKMISQAGFVRENYGEGKEIMLIADNSIFFIVNYLAIIKSGNAVVLVETNITKEQLNKIIRQCSLSAIFVQQKYNSIIDINLDIYSDTSFLQSQSSDSDFTSTQNDNDMAVIIFTSGSTGDKKGVMLSHNNIKENTKSIIQYFNLQSSDRIEVVLPFYYCFGTSLLHTHLRIGGSMVLNHGIFLGSAIKDINKYECTGFAGVPATYQILVNKAELLNQNFPSLRYFAQAGGKLPDNFILRISDAFPNINFFVMYGATEATARLSYLPPDLVKKKMGSIGRGIPGVSLEVLNEAGVKVKPKEFGEITARGKNIMLGYYKDKSSTEEVLKDGRYYTGDLATVDEEGFIYIVDRKKNIIKSAGYRISPYEIENVIVKHNEANNSVVVGVVDDIKGEEIIAIIEAKNPSNELEKEILELCNQELASYKVPQHIIFLEKFPLNSSHKVDRLKVKALALEKLNKLNV